MELWLDVQISPLLAPWIQKEFNYTCYSLRDLQLRDADDVLIFNRAKQRGKVVLLTKDEDFSQLLNRLKSPPKIIWLTFGNCSNHEMKILLKNHLNNALQALEENDLVEISR